MIDPKLLRDDPEIIAESLRRRGSDLDLGALIDLEAAQRTAIQKAEELRASQNEASRMIATLEDDAKQAAIEDVSDLATAQKKAGAHADELAAVFRTAFLEMPNLVDPTAADGYTEQDAVEINGSGMAPPRVRTMPRLVNHSTSSTPSEPPKSRGAGLGYLKGKGALIELSLVRWAIDNLSEAGFTPMIPPVLVREHALEGTGFFPEAREQVYELPKDDLFLVGTSEVSMAAYHGDEILDGDDLPLRYAGFSSCFRREAGTYGKNTGGIFRVHQFDKVEMFVFIEPEESVEEHERLLEVEESLVRQLEVPYRVVNVAAGDLGASAAKKYDIEAWFPGEQAFREITSCSNTTDFQARRLKIRAKGEKGNRVLHTLNGTACAVGRTIIALLENHQQLDGSVVIPEALRPYTGFDSIEP